MRGAAYGRGFTSFRACAREIAVRHRMTHHRDPQTGYPDYICGVGRTSEEALNILLQQFVDEAIEHSRDGKLEESDFEWSAHEDF